MRRIFVGFVAVYLFLLFFAYSASANNEYIVKKGDSLIKIAKTLHLDAKKIKKLNPNVNWLRIRPKQKIKIYSLNTKPHISKLNKDINKYNFQTDSAFYNIKIKSLRPPFKTPSLQAKSDNFTHFQVKDKCQSVLEKNNIIKERKISKQKIIAKLKLTCKKSVKPGHIGDGCYKIKHGDTLCSISHKFGISLKTIRSLNPKLSKYIKPGDIVMLPRDLTKKIMISRKENLYIHPKYLVYSIAYHIKKGDSLWSIGKKYNVKVDTIKLLNNLNSNNLRIGTVIFIPNSKMIKIDKLNFEYSLLKEKRLQLVNYAKNFLGNPYVFGGSSLLHGIDCSGFTQKIYRKFHVNLPRTAEGQYEKVGFKVPLNRLQVGDLLFFHTLSYAHVTHVGIYIGNGRFIHAAGRKSGIKISRLTHYYVKRLVGAKRVLDIKTVVKYVSSRRRSG